MCSCNRSRDYDKLLKRYEKLVQAVNLLHFACSGATSDIVDLMDIDDKQKREEYAKEIINAVNGLIDTAKKRVRECGVSVDD